ncbi:alkane 1-monooxygenase [Micractinium conductrix]|uniref:Alkane 1-monooxygenase n=1 Tax=Micractinium conductrix TaxID=554055 RepID=A0A2P6VG56_9CHLO|nr:alkane 1-monooxygenase [Micractinium conductrix]|eukprot:PSC73069.1 alkane 1-monooxygenase [Micractinium conductrix]
MLSSLLQSRAKPLAEVGTARLLSTAAQQGEAAARSSRGLRRFFAALVPIGLMAAWFEWEHLRSVKEMAERDAAAESAGQAPPPHANIHGGITSHGVPIDPANPLHKVLPETECEFCLETRETLWGMVKAMKHEKKAAGSSGSTGGAAGGGGGLPAAPAHAAAAAPAAPRPAERGLDRDGGEIYKALQRRPEALKSRAPTARVFNSSGVRAPAAAAAAASSPRLADTRLGDLFLRLLPGQLYYLPALLYPLVSLAAGLGAAYGPSLAARLAALPFVKALGPVSPLLRTLATTQPWSALLCVLGSLLTAQFAFLAMPVLDVLLGRDLRQPTQEEEAAVAGAQGLLYRGVLFAYVPLHLGMLLGMCHILSTTPTLPLAFVGATLSAAVAGGPLFAAAHELVHGPSWFDRLAANVLLLVVGYPHWAESHLAHHVKVATPEDPSSARRGEPLYTFVSRSVWGNFVDGYGAEARRLQKRGIPLTSRQNRMWWWVGGPLALSAAAYVIYGWKGLVFWVGQALLSVLMLETVNYVEHYGLQRQKGPDGRYERVAAQHSWNTSFLFTNAVSFRLQRHADHHIHGTRPFQLLRDVPEAPQLPFSYPVAMMLATVPPL